MNTDEEKPTPKGGDGAPGKPKKEKKVPEGLVIPPKKPKLTKAERRALQEQQRAAKAGDQKQKQGKKGNEGGGGEGPKSDGKQQQQAKGAGAGVGAKKSSGPAAATEKKETVTATRSTLVATLPPYRDPSVTFRAGGSLQPQTATTTATSSSSSQQHWHPEVIALGYKYATGEIRGGNSRCRHMLGCFEILLRDFEPPEKAEIDYRHVLDQQVLKSSFQFWTEHCRPHSVSMGNAFTVLKAAVASLDRSRSYDDMRSMLLETIHAYRQERIDFADRAIADLACQKLLSLGGGGRAAVSESKQQVILTYGYSEVVDMTLQQAAADQKTNFRVIVVDSQPLLEGKQLLSKLRGAGIECTYVLLNSLTYVLQDVDKVLLGASALMSDGSIWGRAGTGSVALAAHSQHIPVLVLSETYKISNRVQLESLTTNELGSALEQSTTEQQASNDKSNNPNLKQLDLLYDLTPARFVSGIVTELGIIPPTSVAVLLRELNQAQG
mmetsp:Transcript_26750/g.61516  ORF Transcript_26750/g.61516 Transcript_26750/m.61516 type:complete len:495 (-) Transcript_26750:78-1562(-)